MMMVNEHGLAGSADMTSPIKEDQPRGRGVSNPYILRLIAEQAQTCQHALEIVHQMIRDRWYAGGKKSGTHWLFADRTGKALRIAQNSHEEEHEFVEDNVVFLVREEASAAQSLLARRGRITLADMNATATDPEICFKSSISALTVRIDRQDPSSLDEVWFALPAWSLYVPVFAPSSCVPQSMIDGTLYGAGHLLLDEAKIFGRSGVSFPAPLAAGRQTLQGELYAQARRCTERLRACLGRGDVGPAVAEAESLSADACAQVMRFLSTRGKV
jgi:hypothetical protein